jgi:hypothetical protein
LPPTDSPLVTRFFQLRWLSAAVLAASTACSPGRSAFREGRLPAAAAELRAEEPARLAEGGPAWSRYALERGLVELGLGNARAADHFLTIAKRAHDRDPGLFDDREHGELFAAWRSLGRMPGEQR